MLQRLFALMLIIAILIGPNTVYAASMTETDEDNTLGIIRADLDGITVSADDVQMWKSMNYAISFEVRERNGFWLWLFGGDLKHEIKTENCLYYSR